MSSSRRIRLSPRAAAGVLRAAAALLLFIHGVARVRLGLVDDFGVFLGEVFPLPPVAGHTLAWLLTVAEIVGAPLLAVGLLRRWLSTWFGIQLAFGIALVHAPEGWFVVGAGRNGAEYSVLLLLVLVLTSWCAEAEPSEGIEHLP